MNDCCRPPGSKVTALPTPRVAESLDDLRAGAVVLMLDAESPMKSWTEKVLIGPENAGQDDWEPHLSSGHIVILADPPAPRARDWLVPADTMKALRGEVEAWEESGRAHDPLSIRAVSRARAVLDAATEVEHG